MTEKQEALAELKQYQLKLVQNSEQCERLYGPSTEIRTLRSALRHIEDMIAVIDDQPKSEI